MTSKTTMTPVQATSFNRHSVANAVQVKHSLSCGCEPYQDVFTYKRWLAQGYQVQRGQHSIKLAVIVEVADGDTEDIKKLFRTSHVFCRCQVKPVSAKTGPAKPEPQNKLMEDWRTV